MPAVISMLRGVNVGGHRKVGMEALRTLYESLGFEDPQTYIQSGNVVFRTKARDLVAVAARIEDAIGESYGFRPDVILRTAAELRDAITRNPFAARPGIDPAKLLVMFLSRHPDA